MAPQITIGMYDVSSLEAALLAFQAHYEADSATFYAAYRTGEGDLAGRVSRLNQHRWADFYSEWLELTGQTPDVFPHEDGLAGHVRRDLACA
jgi:hypothetical protein